MRIQLMEMLCVGVSFTIGAIILAKPLYQRIPKGFTMDSIINNITKFVGITAIYSVGAVYTGAAESVDMRVIFAFYIIIFAVIMIFNYKNRASIDFKTDRTISEIQDVFLNNFEQNNMKYEIEESTKYRVIKLAERFRSVKVTESDFDEQRKWVTIKGRWNHKASDVLIRQFMTNFKDEVKVSKIWYLWIALEAGMYFGIGIMILVFSSRMK